MSLSLEDIKNLIAGQTETLTKMRVQERAEDLDKISDMIQTSVKKQITDAIDPIVKRQDDFETRTNSNYEAMAKEFAHLKKSLENPKPIQTQNQPDHSADLGPQPTQPTPANPTPGSDLPLWDTVEKAERTVGFQPLYKSDVEEICRVHNLEDVQQGMKLLILEYLKFEMKNSVTELENILKVFPQLSLIGTLYMSSLTPILPPRPCTGSRGS